MSLHGDPDSGVHANNHPRKAWSDYGDSWEYEIAAVRIVLENGIVALYREDQRVKRARRVCTTAVEAYGYAIRYLKSKQREFAREQRKQKAIDKKHLRMLGVEPLPKGGDITVTEN